MQAFIENIYRFVRSIYETIKSVIGSVDTVNNYQAYINFLNKNIFDGTLINIQLTYEELFKFVSTWFLVIFFIVFIFKLVFKVINLICLR